MDTMDVIKAFDEVEGEVQTALDRFRADNETAPGIPTNLRTKSSVEVGNTLIDLSQWYEDVIQPRIADAEEREKTTKAALTSIESALRRDLVRDNPNLKKSTQKDLLKAEIQSDMRYIQAKCDFLKWQSVRNHLEREGKAWYRKIETVSRVVTQQSDEMQQGKFRGRTETAGRAQGSPFSGSDRPKRRRRRES